MKTKSITFSLLFAAAAFTLLPNCSGKKEEATTESHAGHADHEATPTDEEKVSEANAPQFEVDAKFQEQLGNVFTSYVSLKEAFVSADVEKVKCLY